ncbi:hypothetical protein [Lactobacillus xylocopicola]|nr:hypothetical protein [Lactobacillus xylocopicola]
MKNTLKKIYHYLFAYDDEKLSIYSQYQHEILTMLDRAMLYRVDVLLSYRDGRCEIGQITKRLSVGRFVLRSANQKLLHVVDLDDIFRIDLA